MHISFKILRGNFQNSFSILYKYFGFFINNEVITKKIVLEKNSITSLWTAMIHHTSLSLISKKINLPQIKSMT